MVKSGTVAIALHAAEGVLWKQAEEPFGPAMLMILRPRGLNMGIAKIL
jgi:hypothetical protein